MRWSKWETEFSLSTAPIKCDFNDDDDDLTRDFKNLSALSLNTILQVYGVASLISVPPHYLIRNLSEIMTVVAHFVCVCVQVVLGTLATQHICILCENVQYALKNIYVIKLCESDSASASERTRAYKRSKRNVFKKPAFILSFGSIEKRAWIDLESCVIQRDTNIFNSSLNYAMIKSVHYFLPRQWI